MPTCNRTTDHVVWQRLLGCFAAADLDTVTLGL